MKKLLAISLSILCLASCAPKEKQQDSNSTATSSADTFPEKAKDMNIYEVNIRQHTPEGTLNAFAEHLPRLQKMGVDILWLMPIQPIGEKNRKGPLGSYYSIKDYTNVNPNFGTLDDFKNLVKEAHDLGMYIILDWVPNHTSFDNAWLETNPEYYMTREEVNRVAAYLDTDTSYYKDSENGLVHEADWSDIALLNLYNKDTRDAMIDAMKFWVTEADIDGFRVDHAGHEIPLYFWGELRNELDPIKNLFWLAEWDEPRMHLYFDMTYDWTLLHMTEAIAKGEETADHIEKHIKNDLALYGQRAYRMNFITNHDENSWAGTINERYGDGGEAFAVFSFTAYGMPLLYGGQEAGLDKRLAFFDKDSIDWSDIKYEAFYTKLIKLKKDNKALFNGEYGAMPEFLEDNNENVLSFVRAKDGNEVIVLINMSKESQNVTFSDARLNGTHTDYFTSEEVAINTGEA
ncbi:alpha-amylase, partial [Fulvivirga sp. RKSG066]|uniref:alpha-amylase family glycosyl hydrolase n=1 Tax=Fulvivirga aurantia TaxID=2529383 RepID=UPI0012BD0CE1